jgi:hypothetical protein
MDQAGRTFVEPGVQDDEELSELLRSNPVQAVVKATNYLEIAVRNLAGDIVLEVAVDSDWQSIASALVSRGVLTSETVQAAAQIVALRNSVIHGPTADPREAALAVEGAITVIRAIRSIPRQVHRAYSLLPLFADPNASKLYGKVEGLMICSFDTPGTDSRFTVFPTQGWYEPGARLTWRWDVTQAVGIAWYRHPIGGTIVKGWDKAALFVGAPMAETDASARYWLQESRPWAVRTKLTMEQIQDVAQLQEVLAATDAKLEPAGVWSVWHVVEAPNERLAEAVVRSGIQIRLEQSQVVGRVLDSYVYPGTSVSVGYLPA